MSTTGIDDPKQITTTFEAINKRISIQLNSKLYLTMKCHCLFTSLNYCFFFTSNSEFNSAVLMLHKGKKPLRTVKKDA